MTVTAAEARDKYLGIGNEDFKGALIFSRFLTNRDYEGTMGDDTQQLRLSWPTTDFTRPTVNTTRDLTVPNHAGSDISEETLQVNRSYAHSEFERALDLLEGPGEILPTVIRDTNRIMAEAVDLDVLTAWQAGLADARDGANTAGLRLGDATNYVSSAGVPSTAAARKLYPDQIRAIGSTFRGNNWWKLGDPAYDERRPTIITTNGMWTGFETFIDEDKPTEQLVNSFTRSDGVEVGGAVGTWKDIPNFITNNLPLLEVSSKDYHQMLVTNPAAMTLAMKSPVMDIDTGPIVDRLVAGAITKSEGWTVYRRVTIGRTVVHNEYIFRYLFRAEA